MNKYVSPFAELIKLTAMDIIMASVEEEDGPPAPGSGSDFDAHSLNTQALV